MTYSKYLVIFLIFSLPFEMYSQIKEFWQHLDPNDDKILGVGTFKAYQFLKDKKSEEVIVAVIDNGAELTHDELCGKLWINQDEIPNNGIDDDANGYIDDINGWNFLGNQNGENIKRETTELTRIYSAILKDSIKSNKKENFKNKIINDYNTSINDKKQEIEFYNNLLRNFKTAKEIIKQYLNKESFHKNDLNSITDTAEYAYKIKLFIEDVYKAKLNETKINGTIHNLKQDLETRLNPNFNIRQELIGDDTNNLKDSIYGNNKVDAMSPYHGTGVACSIAALWDNKGVSGIAKNVKVMVLRILPNGDERDKDVALAIKYAVRNGANIINCSFGKLYSPHPEFIDEAIKEAENKSVLIIHGSGNDGKNNDSIPTYPTGIYQNGQKATNWLNIGATRMKDSINMVAFFSNYGKETVDIFAPGFEIKSCALANKYDYGSGTSISAPIVSGVAAVIKSYYPYLNAQQIKNFILESGYTPKTKFVYIPNGKGRKIEFSDLSHSGKIVNLYNALLLIENGKID